ncbi:MAG: hypothetical protein OEY70_18730 [Acidimicrobiia bacterium]|nr:hypothetical protein [Acidimicrobiia bacterium]
MIRPRLGPDVEYLGPVGGQAKLDLLHPSLYRLLASGTPRWVFNRAEPVAALDAGWPTVGPPPVA